MLPLFLLFITCTFAYYPRIVDVYKMSSSSDLLMRNCPHADPDLVDFSEFIQEGQEIAKIPAGVKALFTQKHESLNLQRVDVGNSAWLVFDDDTYTVNIKNISSAPLSRIYIGSSTCRLISKIIMNIDNINANGDVDIHGKEFFPTWTRLSTDVHRNDFGLADFVNWEQEQLFAVPHTAGIDIYSIFEKNGHVIDPWERTKAYEVNTLYQTEVALLSRNIVMNGTSIYIGGFGCDGRFSGVQFVESKDTPITYNSPKSRPSASYVSDVSFVNTTRCVANGNSNQFVYRTNVQNSVAYNVSGDCFVDGIYARNSTYQNNIVIGATGDCFYSAGKNVAYIGNTANHCANGFSLINNQDIRSVSFSAFNGNTAGFITDHAGIVIQEAANDGLLLNDTRIHHSNIGLMAVAADGSPNYDINGITSLNRVEFYVCASPWLIRSADLYVSDALFSETTACGGEYQSNIMIDRAMFESNEFDIRTTIDAESFIVRGLSLSGDIKLDAIIQDLDGSLDEGNGLPMVYVPWNALYNRTLCKLDRSTLSCPLYPNQGIVNINFTVNGVTDTGCNDLIATCENSRYTVADITIDHATIRNFPLKNIKAFSGDMVIYRSIIRPTSKGNDFLLGLNGSPSALTFDIHTIFIKGNIAMAFPYPPNAELNITCGQLRYTLPRYEETNRNGWIRIENYLYIIFNSMPNKLECTIRVVRCNECEIQAVIGNMTYYMVSDSPPTFDASLLLPIAYYETVQTPISRARVNTMISEKTHGTLTGCGSVTSHITNKMLIGTCYYDTYEVGETCELECDVGFSPSMIMTAECMGNNTWYVPSNTSCVKSSVRWVLLPEAVRSEWLVVIDKVEIFRLPMIYSRHILPSAMLKIDVYIEHEEDAKPLSVGFSPKEMYTFPLQLDSHVSFNTQFDNIHVFYMISDSVVALTNITFRFSVGVSSTK